MIRSGRIGLAHAALAVFAAAVLVQSARVQLLQGRAWRARAERQQITARAVPAPRGDILSATGLPLARSREMVKLEVAPREVKDPGGLRRALARAGVPREWADRAADGRRTWVTLPGRYLAIDVAPATAMRGVHATSASVRVYAMSEGTRRLVGRVDADDRPLDGVELALDSLLRGAPGSATLLRDVRGRRFESPTAPGVAPVAGHTVVLTLNQELQEITDRALADAVASNGADGGDLVVLDPFSGEVLALASRRADPRSTAATALTEPFEPGSTLKPFIAAALLEHHRVAATDSVDTGSGELELNGRVIHDDHLVGRASLATVLRWSSNVGIVKFASRLAPREQFEALRDFGFGTATGVQYPSESNGTLRAPPQWSVQSPASLAMGYEIAVTPLQLAAAYATFANGGELVQPTLVKEVRDARGRVVYRHERRVVRRVVSPAVAEQVRRMLVGVVEGGTALRAVVAGYELAGKTGTPRRTVGRRYAANEYNPNFVGLFPGNAPQYVIVAKLINPRVAHYAAETAAPLTKMVLQAAIAARDAALDRDRLAASAAGGRPDSPAVVAPATEPAPGERGLTSRLAGADDGAEPGEEPAGVPYVVALPQTTQRPRPAAAPRPVPDVTGMPLRDAVRSLHTAGFHVQLVRGAAGATTPAAGTLAPAGSLVRLLFDF